MNTPVAPATQNRAPAPPLLQGKVVLVCGVGPDLGRSLAVRSAQAGADIVLAARSADRLNLIEQEIRDNMWKLQGKNAKPPASAAAKPVSVSADDFNDD